MKTRIAVLVGVLGICILVGYGVLSTGRAAPVNAQDEIQTVSCTLSNLVGLIEETSLTQSQKTALINAIDRIHYYVCLYSPGTSLRLEKTLDKRMQKFVSRGQMDSRISGQIMTCIEQFMTDCGKNVVYER